MPTNAPLIRNISDTAYWAALYRAEETMRPDALFRDPLAARLAGDRGRAVRDSLPSGARRAWPWVTRTHVFDQLITQTIGQGADLVLNLAAGLDTRPYRLSLPPALPWIEVDLPDLLDDKTRVLQDERPACVLERVRLDLADRVSRQELFSMIGLRAKRALVITEGLLVYLSPDDAGALAEDLARQTGFEHWLFDLVSPGLLAMLTKEIGSPLAQAGAPFKFGPDEGVEFFAPHGWQPVVVTSMLKAAGALGRLPFGLRLMSFLPEAPRPGQRPWSGACLCQRRKN
jgi:methyltransferase (TIGR00027 family)